MAALVSQLKSVRAALGKSAITTAVQTGLVQTPGAAIHRVRERKNPQKKHKERKKKKKKKKREKQRRSDGLVQGETSS